MELTRSISDSKQTKNRWYVAKNLSRYQNACHCHFWFRFPSKRIQWKETVYFDYAILDWREEPIFGNCIYRSWLSLFDFWFYLLGYPHESENKVGFYLDGLIIKDIEQCQNLCKISNKGKNMTAVSGVAQNTLLLL